MSGHVWCIMCMMCVSTIIYKNNNKTPETIAGKNFHGCGVATIHELCA